MSKRLFKVGAIIHNASGDVMTDLAKKMDDLLSLTSSEAKAIVLSILWARNVNLNLHFLELNMYTRN